jgi:hypothetical protein
MRESRLISAANRPMFLITMDSPRSFRFSGVAAALAVVAVSMVSQVSAQDGTPKKIDIANIPAETIGQVIIPIPQEVFASLNKLGARNWRNQLSKRDVELDGDRSRTALLFGLVIADGFIAVQAENRDEVTRIGREVQRLAGALGVKSEVDGHALAIIDGARDSEWNSVKRELDKARQTVIDTMKELRDDEFADLVSIGGWLGGTRALAALLEEDYSVEAAELLHQPDLVSIGGWLGGTRALAALLEEDYSVEAAELLHQPDLVVQIAKSYAALPTAAKPGPIYSGVTDTLQQLALLMRGTDDGTISKDSVITIQKLTGDLTEKIYEP